MLAASVKEFEKLDSEIKGIKDCITTYIGYIIGSNGIAFLLFGTLKVFTEHLDSDVFKTLSYSADLILTIEILLILFIYSIMNYKFASHNRYVGYRQLLSQEIYHQKITIPSPIGSSDIDAYPPSGSSEIDFKQDIFTWDYVSSKWNNRIRSKEYPKEKFDKLDMRLILPSGYNSYEVHLENEKDQVAKKKNAIQKLFEKIIWKGFKRIMGHHIKNENEQITEKKNAIQMFFEHIIWKGFKRTRRHYMYKKFVISSWRFPGFIFLLISILLGISFTLLFLLNMPEVYLHPFLVIVSVIWFFYSLELRRLLIRDKTIDYYCWAFLAFRTRLLNNYGIRPYYISTSFHRYIKALKIVEFIQNQNAIKNYPSDLDAKGVNKTDICKVIISGGILKKRQKEFVKKMKEVKSAGLDLAES